MTVVSHKTQGTELYYANAAATVLKVGQVSGLGQITSPTDDIDQTVLDSTAREFASGFATVGDMTFPIVFNSQNASHMALIALKAAGTVASWAILFSEAATAPTASGSVIIPATDRTSIKFDAYVKDVSFEFGINDVVRGSVTLKVSGAPTIAAAA